MRHEFSLLPLLCLIKKKKKQVSGDLTLYGSAARWPSLLPSASTQIKYLKTHLEYFKQTVPWLFALQTENQSKVDSLALNPFILISHTILQNLIVPKMKTIL